MGVGVSTRLHIEFLNPTWRFMVLTVLTTHFISPFSALNMMYDGYKYSYKYSSNPKP